MSLSKPVPSVLLAFASLLSAAGAASAQSFTFTSCTGVVAKVTITGNLTNNGSVSFGGYTTYSWSFTGTYSLTVGGATQTTSGFGTGGVTYFAGNSFAPPSTTFGILTASPSPPGTITAMPGWGVQLQGFGTLLTPGVWPTVLPPLSSWDSPPEDYISYPGNLSAPEYYLACAGSSGGSFATQALGSPANLPGCVFCGEVSSGDPINIGNGNVFEYLVDYKTSGANPLSYIRYYNSLASSTTYASTLGANWRSNYDRYLRIVSATSVTAERADGQQIPFTLNNGVWTTDTDIDVTLTNSGSTWTLTDRDDTVESYIGTSEGVLQTIQSRNGYTQTMQYDANNLLTSVTDSFARQLTFTYANGLLQTVTTPDGEVLTFGFTGNNLTSISYPTSPVTSQTYLYENSSFPNALTSLIDENGSLYSSWTYDSTGRALSNQHAGGADLVQVAYNDSDGSRTVTNALGEQELYKFTTLQNVPKVTEADRLTSAGVAAATRTFTYDTNGYLASRTDWNGNLTKYTNDSHGQPTTMIEASGSPQSRTTNTTYHPTFHLPVQTVTPGLTTNFTYDSTGELLTRTLTDTTTTSVPYATAGQTRTWTYTWSNFLIASIQTPRAVVSGVTSFTYDGSGALTAFTNALGQITQITQHSPGGLPQTIVDPNGVNISLAYDPRLRLLSRTIATAAGPMTTSYGYDAVEQQVSFTLPDGSALSKTYDGSHRLTGISDLLGQSVSYTLDAQGDRTQTSVTDASSTLQLTHSGVFDALGRIQQGSGASGQITAYTYDANGNPLTVTDPLNHSRSQTYDALNRVITVTNAAKGIAKVTYDAYNRPLSVTDPNGSVTTYIYDGFGDVIERISPDSGTTIYQYDLDGNLAQRVDGAGATTNYSYDALDRVSGITYPADPAENVVFTYDQGSFGVGRLTGVTDAVGTLARTYDERGNVLNETRVNGNVTLATSYTYDAANRVASITYPSGWIAAYTRDAMGRTTSVSAQPPAGGASAAAISVLANVAYQPFGPINSLSFGNGITESSIFDLDYRLTSRTDIGTSTAVAVQSLTYLYDASNNVSSVTDGVTAANSQNFGYDVLNRLTAAAGAYGSLGYAYDSTGNRLSETGGASAMTYAYAAKSNRLTAMTAGGVTDSIGYDKAGDINSFNPAPAGGITGTVYNQAGRLSTVMAGNDVAAQYTYDGFGRRLTRAGAITSTTLYQYDRSGRLIEETDGDGNALVDYIYVGSMPVATISPSQGQVFFLHGDRLGTPQLATDMNQNVVWAANYGPFGEMSSIPSGIVQDLRLPGQEFDAETGLYHNGFRDYVPEWGRYLETDPIGIGAGGLNTYGYAYANPLTSVDPLGLCDLLDQVEKQAEGVLDWFQENLQDKLMEPATEAFEAFAQYGSQAEAGLILAAQDAVAGPIGAFQAGYAVTRGAIQDLRLMYPGWFAFYFPTSVEQFSLVVNMDTALPAIQKAQQMQSQPIGTLQGGVNSPFVIVPPKPVAAPGAVPTH